MFLSCKRNAPVAAIFMGLLLVLSIVLSCGQTEDGNQQKKHLTYPPPKPLKAEAYALLVGLIKTCREERFDESAKYLSSRMFQELEPYSDAFGLWRIKELSLERLKVYGNGSMSFSYNDSEWCSSFEIKSDQLKKDVTLFLVYEGRKWKINSLSELSAIYPFEKAKLNKVKPYGIAVTTEYSETLISEEFDGMNYTKVYEATVVSESITPEDIFK